MAQRSPSYAGTLPYWTDSASFPTFAKLERDIAVDTLVVGAGLTGLSTAYLLQSAGKSVAVLERARCAQIDTGHTSAHLTMVTDTRLGELVRRFGRTHAQAVWDAGRAAIEQVDQVVAEHEIECGFGRVDGYLHAVESSSSKEVDELRAEATLATELGFDAEFSEAVPTSGRPGIRFEHQARFHPRKYLAGLAKAFRAKGGEIFEHSEAGEFCTGPLRIKVNDCWVRCEDVVIATHNPLVGVANRSAAAAFQTNLALYTSYVVAGRVPSRTVEDSLFWDTAEPYHYLRIEPHRDHDLVIFGGEDHKTGQVSDTTARYERLERMLQKRIPGISLTHRWSGQVIDTPDGLPYIGRMTDHQYAATGFAGNGLTFGTLAGMMIADALIGRPNPWTELFDPNRPATTSGLWDYIKENADYPYYMMRDQLVGAEGRSLRSVTRGQGKVIEYRGSKVAAYRDAKGSTTLRSAVCTHMGCLVGWNNAEHTWDCPCHGSRFAPDGKVIAGPAESPLDEVK